jgi:bifunctional non-homologous end joining protein LigD
MRPFAFIEPCLATLRPKPPEGPGYIHEVNFDGHRLQIHKDAGDVRLFTRNGHDCTARFAPVAEAVGRLARKQVVIDAELVASDRLDWPDFYGLTFRRYAPGDLKAWAFDLLWLNGKDLRGLPLFERRWMLEKMLRVLEQPSVGFSESFDDGEALLRQCERFRLEAVVSKRRDAPYRSGRSSAWVKVKCAGWRVANRERYRIFEKAR